MPEILTESFCERCGTRYTFESAAPRAAKLKGIKVLSRGLKNFVMSDDTSMDEAMAAARSETDREVTSQQLDAFHKTFNFCMSCRQYTCGNCWNEADGQCLSCSPHLGHEILPSPFPDLDAHGGIQALDGLNGSNGSNGASDHVPAEDALVAMAWPTSDLMRDAEAEDAPGVPSEAELPEPIDAAARLAALGAIEDGPVVEAPEPIAAADATGSVESTPTVDASDVVATDARTEFPTRGPAGIPADDVDGRAAAAADQTSDLFRRFRPGQSLDDEIAAYERDREAAASTAAAAAAAAAAGAGAGASIAPEPAAQPEPPAVAAPATDDAGHHGLAAAAAPGAAAARDDIVEQPTWQIVAPDTSEAGVSTPPSSPPVTPPMAPGAAPEWPSQPQWPSHQSAGGLPFLGRQAAPTGGMEALWAESAREVATTSGPAKATAGVQPCVSCGLSLSATARFCRRCGTRQG